MGSSGAILTIMKTLCILGRQPALGVAELESIFGAAALQLIGTNAVIVEVDPSDLDINRFGGTMKVCEYITTLQSAEWPKIIAYLSDALPQMFRSVKSGKLTIGLSLYGFSINPGKINAAALGLKKNLKSADRGVRIVPNKQPELNTAQITHNQLTGPHGIELVIVRAGKRTLIARTRAVQDIDAYAARDQVRPARDARVGMLPPKLAQIILNLAIGDKHGPQITVVDPFCGTGVVLQEALLLGYHAYGTDLEPRMIDYSKKNLDWLSKNYNLDPKLYSLSVGDATSYKWASPFMTIACETYLGRPFSSIPDAATLNEVMRDVDTIHRKFLQNTARQTNHGFRLCIAVPAWRTKNGFRHLPVLDQLTDLGYNRVSFVHARNADLIYHRPEQIVARELVVLERS